MEFSLRLLSEPEEWIPIRFTYNSDTDRQAIYIGAPGEDFRLRGYKVEQSMVFDGWNKFEIQICNFSLSDSIQFRWLQTSILNPGGISDVWFMDNITINLVQPSSRSNLLVEEFNSGNLKLVYYIKVVMQFIYMTVFAQLFCSSDIWPSHHVRNGNVSSYCGTNDSLVFGLNSIYNTRSPSINSQSLLTNIFNLTSDSSAQITTPHANKFNLTSDNSNEATQITTPHANLFNLTSDSSRETTQITTPHANIFNLTSDSSNETTQITTLHANMFNQTSDSSREPMQMTTPPSPVVTDVTSTNSGPTTPPDQSCEDAKCLEAIETDAIQVVRKMNYVNENKSLLF